MAIFSEIWPKMWRKHWTAFLAIICGWVSHVCTACSCWNHEWNYLLRKWDEMGLCSARHGSPREDSLAGWFLIAILKSHFFLSKVAMAKRANQWDCQIFPPSIFHLTWMVQIPVATNRENRNISHRTPSSNELTERPGRTCLISPANAHSSHKVRWTACCLQPFSPVFLFSPHSKHLLVISGASRLSPSISLYFQGGPALWPPCTPT